MRACIASGNTGSACDETGFHDRTVNYFDNGFVNRDFIVAGIANYHHRWPIRNYEIIAGPEISTTAPQGVYDVSCRTRCQVQNVEKGIEGVVFERMLIRPVKDGLVILNVNSSMEPRRVTPGRRALRITPPDPLGRPVRTNGTGR